jgi:hypothetical protein
VSPADRLAQRTETLPVEHPFDDDPGKIASIKAGFHVVKDPFLRGFVGVVDDDFQHEAIHLRFRQGVRPLELHRVLRGEDGEDR